MQPVPEELEQVPPEGESAAYASPLSPDKQPEAVDRLLEGLGWEDSPGQQQRQGSHAAEPDVAEARPVLDSLTG